MDESMDVQEMEGVKESEAMSKNIRLMAGGILALIVFTIGVFLIIGSSPEKSNASISDVSSVGGRVKSVGVTGEPRMFTPGQLQEHASGLDCYISYKSVVYDISDYISEHPGGPKISEMCGQVLDDFGQVHEGGNFEMSKIQRELQKYEIGKLSE